LALCLAALGYGPVGQKALARALVNQYVSVDGWQAEIWIRVESAGRNAWRIWPESLGQL
jgi:hypothetical protein